MGIEKHNLLNNIFVKCNRNITPRVYNRFTEKVAALLTTTYLHK